MAFPRFCYILVNLVRRPQSTGEKEFPVPGGSQTAARAAGVGAGAPAAVRAKLARTRLKRTRETARFLCIPQTHLTAGRRPDRSNGGK